jgi:hypothetical protein
MDATRARVIIGWTLLVVSVLGLGVTFPLWLLNLISDRAMLGITLVLSWLALAFEAWTTLQVASDRHADES